MSCTSGRTETGYGTPVPEFIGNDALVILVRGSVMKIDNRRILILTSHVESTVTQLLDLLTRYGTVKLCATNPIKVMGDRRDAWSLTRYYWIDPVLTMLRVGPLLWRYETVITYYHRHGYWVGLFRRLFNVSQTRKFIWVGFAPNPPQSRWFGRLKEAITRHALIGYDLIICNTKPLCDSIKIRFPEVAQRVACVRWGGKSGQPIDSGVVDSEYVFCGGRTNRDFDTVLKAVTELGCPTVFVTAKEFSFRLGIPEFVSVYRDIPEQAFYELMKSAKIVIVALKRSDISSGQVVLCNAMTQAKAVIVSNTAGLGDYVTEGKDALFYTPGDVEDLKDKLVILLTDTSKRQTLGQAARITYEQKFNSRVFAQGLHDRIVEIITLH